MFVYVDEGLCYYVLVVFYVDVLVVWFKYNWVWVIGMLKLCCWLLVGVGLINFWYLVIVDVVEGVDEYYVVMFLFDWLMLVCFSEMMWWWVYWIVFVLCDLLVYCLL